MQLCLNNAYVYSMFLTSKMINKPNPGYKLDHTGLHKFHFVILCMEIISLHKQALL